MKHLVTRLERIRQSLRPYSIPDPDEGFVTFSHIQGDLIAVNEVADLLTETTAKIISCTHAISDKVSLDTVTPVITSTIANWYYEGQPVSNDDVRALLRQLAGIPILEWTVLRNVYGARLSTPEPLQ